MVASDPTARGIAHNATAALTGARRCLPKQPGGAEPPVPPSRSLSALANWLLSSTTAHMCMRNLVVSRGELAGGNTGLRCSHLPTQLISPPTPQCGAASALPAQLGEQQGIPRTALVKGFTSGTPSLRRSSKRWQARMPHPSSFLTQAQH